MLAGVLGKIPRPTPAMAVALLALLIAASGAAVAAIPGGDGTIRACYAKNSGALRVIDTAQTCTSKETLLTWINGLPGSTAANADKLDNKDSTEFYAAGSKVADSEKLDGIDSSGFAAFKSTVVVSPVGKDTENGQVLLDAITNITDASQSKPYLIHIEPATYDLGNGSLGMKPFVDIEGSGELNTVITSGVTDQLACLEQPAGTVNGANNAEMRFLTVRNTGTTGTPEECHVAISNNSASPRLTHLTAQSTGEGNGIAIAVSNSSSSLTMIDVTATASGGSGANHGVFDSNSSSIIRHSKLSAIGGGSALTHVGGTAKVALSEIEGGFAKPSGTGGTLQCFNNYNENMAAVSCP
jgi:hypothetical protein